MAVEILGGENSLSATVRPFPEIESLECRKIGAGHLGRVPCGKPWERGPSAVAVFKLVRNCSDQFGIFLDRPHLRATFTRSPCCGREPVGERRH